ncbi:unnamed protein product [Calicophoron daubneyi]|uniref:Uncharacterized protein n=1 Tax=Calicophoron daubneyi TaxID=300641 RepID=A0AAV2T260_CALDB
MTIGTNYLGPFLLTELLLPLLKKAAPSRVINVSSMVHFWASLEKPDLQISKGKYSLQSAYNQSKLCNAMHAYEFNRRFQGTGVTAVSLHPGVVQTRFFDPFTSVMNIKVFASGNRGECLR